MTHREIKFRGWNKQAKVMVDLRKITPLALDEKLVGQDGIYLPFIDNLVLMQFTGLRDKNGKDIYEDDILQSKGGDIMIVNWNEKFASFCLDKKGWLFSHYFGEAVDPNDCEVIGDIHQNPELLK